MGRLDNASNLVATLSVTISRDVLRPDKGVHVGIYMHAADHTVLKSYSTQWRNEGINLCEKDLTRVIGSFLRESRMLQLNLDLLDTHYRDRAEAGD